MNKTNNRFVGFGWLMLFFTFALPIIVHSQTPLPTAAQEAFDNGIIAAKVPDYVLAIRYFEEARKIAPDAAMIYFNLGLAESKIPGRELRAICWFSAFLAADPNSTNVPAVKEQIQILKIKSQSNISRLIKMLQDAPPKDHIGIGHVAKLWADSGDVPTALKVALSIENDNWVRGSAQANIAESQAQAGDFQGALKTAEIVVEPYYQTRAFLAITKIQLENGDLAGVETSLTGARRTTDLITEPQNKLNLLREIADIQIKAGNKTAAQSTLKAALAVTDSIKIETDPQFKDTGLRGKTQEQTFIAETQIKAGDSAGAKEALLMAFKNSELIGDPYSRADYQGNYIMVDQAQAGDNKNAMKTYQAYLKSMNQITNASQKSNIAGYLSIKQLFLAKYLAESGDFANALKVANEINNSNPRDSDNKAGALQRIAEAQAVARDFDGATKTAEMIQNSEKKGWAISKINEEKAKANTPPTPIPTATPQLITPKPPPPPLTAKEWIGRLSYLEANHFLDLAGYLKTIPANDADKMFGELQSSISRMIEQQNFVINALKRKPTEQK